MAVNLEFLARSQAAMMQEIRATRTELRMLAERMDAQGREVRGLFADLDAKVTGIDLRLAEVHMDHEKRLETLEDRHGA